MAGSTAPIGIFTRLPIFWRRSLTCRRSFAKEENDDASGPLHHYIPARASSPRSSRERTHLRYLRARVPPVVPVCSLAPWYDSVTTAPGANRFISGDRVPKTHRDRAQERACHEECPLGRD